MLLSILRTSVGSVLGGGSGISKSSQLSSVSGGVGGRFACLSSISSECLSCEVGSSIGARTERMVYTSVRPNGFVTSLIHICSYKKRQATQHFKWIFQQQEDIKKQCSAIHNLQDYHSSTPSTQTHPSYPGSMHSTHFHAGRKTNSATIPDSRSTCLHRPSVRGRG